MGRGTNSLKSKGLFASPFVRQITDSTGVVEKKRGADLSGSNISSTSSFLYDAPGTGLRSTQQVELDWSKFENHTFFNSAEAKVNVSFDTIINRYPFDGSRQELDGFFDELTGYEKYIYEKFPKNRGYLHFSGTTQYENPGGRGGGGTTDTYDPNLGTYIQVKDFAGNLFPNLSADNSGRSIIDPGLKSISFEMQLFIPSQSIDTKNQIILQKLNGDSHGFTISLSGSNSNEPNTLLWMLASSGTHCIKAGAKVEKNRWQHIVATYNRSPGINKIQIFNDTALLGISDSYRFGEIDFKTSPLYIGSGSAHVSSSLGEKFVPLQTLSGAIDELRVFHDIRPVGEQKTFAYKNIFPDSENNIKLYFKLNEPNGSYTNNDVALDSSGNSLHSRISNYIDSVNRVKEGFSSSSVGNPMVLEGLQNNPILFPSYDGVTTLNSDLLSSASLYDVNNPNLITKLVPKHYFLEASADEGYEKEDGGVGDTISYYDDEAIPGGAKIGSPLIMGMMLYTWAKYFDELKIYIDQFSNLLHVDYDDDDIIPLHLLPFLANYYGFELPNAFSNASISQLIEGRKLKVNAGMSTLGLRKVQNEIWKRILINLQEIIRSKGTMHAIKAFIRSTGINPDNNFRFREYGGSRTQDLTAVRKNKTEISTLLDLSGSLTYSSPSATVNIQGVGSEKGFLQSKFLSASRVEPGIPFINGTMVDQDLFGHGVNGISNDRSDGLLTSGSWTCEGYYKFLPQINGRKLPHSSSLMRMHVTGLIGTAGVSHGVIANLVALQPEPYPTTGSLRLFIRPGAQSSSPYLDFSLNDVNIFDGNKWYVSFGRTRNDQCDSIVSSSYFIRAGRQNFGQLTEFKSASIFFEETTAASTLGRGGVLQNVHQAFNVSGSFLVIGSQSLEQTSIFLNNSSFAGEMGQYTNFCGKVGRVNFWSKGLTMEESMEHATNFKSIGVIDPLINFNFVTTRSGSFQRLRMNVTTDQPITKSDSHGSVQLFDFSQNNYHMSGSGFESNKRVIKPERFDYSIIDAKFDEHSNSNKIRIRSWENYENVEMFGGELGPVYEILPSERPKDDSRFAMEISSVQALNEDIANIFTTLKAMDNALGAPELLFATSYPELDDLREVYFNRLTKKINIQEFFDFFKWFDTQFGIFIEKLLPKRTKFMGVNFVIESHMLERAKMNYNYADMYVGENNRHGLKGTILLRQLVGDLKRY